MPVFEENSKAPQPGTEDFIYLLFGTLTLQSVLFVVLVYLLFGSELLKKSGQIYLKGSYVTQLESPLGAFEF